VSDRQLREVRQIWVAGLRPVRQGETLDSTYPLKSLLTAMS
jgi:hypothetical protein